MAGGEGGFSTKAMGFDKKEVNDYIANLNQRMKEIEAEKKANDEKTQTALKKAQEADSKIKALKDESEKKIADLELQLKTERRNEENLLIQIDDLKRKLKQKGTADAGNSKAADAKSAEIIAKANASAKDIIDKANAAARDTVEKAKAQAQRMVSQAQAAGASSVNTEGLDEFMSVLGAFMNKVTSGVNEVNQKASELLGANAAQPVTVPDFSNVAAPRAEAPKAAPAPKGKKSAAAAKPSDALDDLFASLEEDENPPAETEEELDMVTEVQPLDDPSNAPGAVVLDEFDLSQPMDIEFDEPVSEVKPINSKKQAKPDVDMDFEKQMLAQTAHSSSLKNVVDDDLLAAVQQQEEQFAVKPSDDDVGDIDMSAEDEDPMAALMRQAELAFGGDSGNVEAEDEEESAPEEDSSGGDNPWAALQNELMAMEKSGDLDDAAGDTAAEASEDPVAPSADDSAIWDFGDSDNSSSDDDDMGMSSDLFGSF